MSLKQLTPLLSLLATRVKSSIKPVHKKLASRYHVTPDQVVVLENVLGSLAEVEDYLNTQPPITLRVNTLKARPEEVMERLKGKGVKLRRLNNPDYVLQVEYTPKSLAAYHEYLQGLYYIQTLGSVYAVEALRPLNTPLVVDMCCGAGGKTTLIAQLAPQSVVLAVDTCPRKLLALKLHLSRLGLDNVVAVLDDARRIPDYKLYPQRILLDPPCSGLGLLSNPAKRRQRSYQDILSRLRLQYELLHAALRAVGRGGAVVYSTCSVAVEENELIISTILEELGDEYTVTRAGINVGDPGITEYMGIALDDRVKQCVRLYPHKHASEGFVVCRIERR